MLIAAVLAATVVLRVALVAFIIYLMLPRGPLCPQCQERTARLRAPWLARLIPLLERRWCLECGWSGVVRRGPPGPRRPSPAPALPAPPTWE